MFAFAVELHLRSYQERKCESLQSKFKLNSLSNFKSFRLRTTAVRGLQSKCKETVNKSWMENGKKTGLRRQCCYRKWEMLIFLGERASRGQSPRLIGFFKLSSNGCSPLPLSIIATPITFAQSIIFQQQQLLSAPIFV